ncbi:TetR/AcrR family transcriptional regulator [Nocardia sp. NEAU-G5]|uniref:TetR/AcrR family transcriptional regulator n=1 Tax=Nocardia albiluteola TaxID=2842303 RepID=A0ABS6AV36_9NOCA|nr:TetR/AcrR family transcriptional regulator [Nocardia albiluteola]MBU3061748.1 TetR/AcrR family transcriptional regulator [Nocardia albiluteola]
MTKTAGPRGRIDKRQAILSAAFAVFARRGYERTCVQEIADEAGVAKPTVYNHLNDKETLFRHTMEAAADAVAAECLAAVEPLRDIAGDPRPNLTTAAQQLLRICIGARAHALRSLAYAESSIFPDLAVAVQERTSLNLAEALADRFARLALGGALRPCDPARAAEHFLSLLTGPLEYHSRLGTRPVPEAELDAIADAALDTFLRAYGPQE